ncbi:neutral zinc metallopeptidase [Chitiniphilus shinanonensis]|uniref:Neutral zinc metallopeptidase n=1 Tax=Chitiniphilus shinanonensis TaxID=553088 RepID=A0ABQ6BTT7_9NEIS|nr:neutral zinc metallopeptidase [Chitiniphilus shinanonensis]GLS04741.1 neutral zinc metallopeptidase [Chitiniphilus shinanonensis]
MRWDKMRESRNVEDRRGMGGGGGVKLGLGGIAVVVVVGLLMGKNPAEILGMLSQVQQTAPATATQQAAPAADDQGRQFVARVLGDTEDTWTTLFAENGGQYQQPRLVLFRGAVNSACGQASSAVGPFYCPGDRQVYLDLGFFDELNQRYRAGGDFAAAYVIAHEVGHHVQNLLGVSDKVHAARQRLGEAGGNALSVKQELQADCLAGVWGHYAQQRGLLEQGDLEEALTAAHAIGDDTLQRNAGRQVVPDSFTHGTSEQRMTWFRRGFDSGRIQSCDTFAGTAQRG